MKYKLLFILIITICSTVNAIGQNQQKLDSLWKAFKQAKHDTIRIKTYLYIGSIFEYEKPDTALFYYQKAVDLADKAIAGPPSPHSHEAKALSGLKATSLRYIGMVYSNQGSYDHAIAYYLKSLKIFEELGDKKGMSNCYNYIGIVHDYQGSYDQAISYYLKSLKIKEELQDKKGMSACYINIGVVHYYQGSNDQAIAYYLKSLKIYEELGDKKGMSHCYTNIGIVHSDQGSYDQAIAYYLKSLKIYEELGDKKGMSLCYNNIGNVHKNQGSYDQAISYYLKSLKIKEELVDKNGIAMVYGNIAGLHITLSDSLELLGVHFDKLSVRGGRAAHLDTALLYGNKAYELALEIGAVLWQNDAAAHLQKAYTKLGKYKEAIKYAEIFITTKDSMFNEEKTKSLAEMGAKYEAEKKQLQIDNLNKENALKQAELAQSEEKRSKQLILIYSFVAGFIIILVFALIIFRLFMQKKKANLLLARQKQQIEIQNANLNQANEEITAQRDEIAAQRDLVMIQKEHIEEQKQEITDSINYAKRIQTAVLPTGAVANKILGNHFILFRPKDIVSGDFYWATKTNEWLIVTVADCTGHGVPGAFMSMLGVSFLNEIVRKKEITQASHVLDQLRTSIIDALSQTGEAGTQKDGMDIVLYAINTNDNTMQFAGANNSLLIIRQLDNVLISQLSDDNNSSSHQHISSSTHRLYEVKADKQPVAIYEHMTPFTNHIIQLNSGDTLYLMSDGYQDQFGGPNGKKFLSKNLKQLLVANCQLSMHKQKQILEKTLVDWIGDGEQVDDITVLGIKV